MRLWSVAKIAIASAPPFLHKLSRTVTQYSLAVLDGRERKILGIVDKAEVCRIANVPSTLSAMIAKTASESAISSMLFEDDNISISNGTEPDASTL
jgi:hypothetical protein